VHLDVLGGWVLQEVQDGGGGVEKGTQQHRENLPGNIVEGQLTFIEDGAWCNQSAMCIVQSASNVLDASSVHL